MEPQPVRRVEALKKPAWITPEETSLLETGSGFLSRFLEHFSAGVVLLKGNVLDGPRVLTMNRAFADMTGLQAEDIESRGLEVLQGPHSDSGLRDHLAQAQEQQRPIRLEARLVRKSQQEFWAVLELYCEHPAERIWVLRLEDITARKMAEETLGRDQERLTATLRSIGEGVILVGTRLEVDFMNREAERLTGRKQSKACGRAFTDVVKLVGHEDHQPRNCPLTTAFRSGKTVGPLTDVMLVSLDGTERRVSCLCVPMIDARATLAGAVVVLRDISSHTIQEKEMHKVQKMESIALLADGIAHDFNNILTGILGNLSLARSCSGEGTRVAGILAAAEKAASRAKDLTYRLAQFSRGGTSTKTQVSLKDLVRECSGFILSGSNCRCRTQIDGSLWTAEVDEGQITQVLNNLLINATQAMPDGGTIILRADNVEIKEESPIPLKPGPYVRIAVKDNGPGIQPENMARIFDPYYTTKKTGTGLGLATSYSIIKGHYGYITVDSEVGKGSIFTFYLPALPSSASVPRRDDTRLYHGKGRILVMDDEVMIQQITGDMLTHLGYEVQFAKDGTEALETYRLATREGNTFDAVLLDLTVPGGLGGKETLDALLAEFPEVRAIISSGYGGSPVVREYRNFGFYGAISKPYNIQQLSRIVSEVVNAQV